MESTVQLTADSPRMSTPGELVAALKHNLGADIVLQIVTRLTSFGKGAPRLDALVANENVLKIFLFRVNSLPVVLIPLWSYILKSCKY